MQNIKTYITCLFLLLVFTGYSQKNLVIYHVAGDVSILSNNKTSAAGRGNTISKGDKLMLRDGGVCMLIESAGKSIQVKKPGTYTFEAMQKLLQNAAKDEVTAKFFSYVYNNMFGSHDDNHQGVTPVVFRDQGLMVYPLDYAIVFSAPVLTWKMPLRNLFVRVLIKDLNNNIILDTVVKKTTSLKALRLTTGNTYVWKAEEAGNKQSPERYFHLLMAYTKDRAAIEKELKILQNNSLSPKIQSQLREDIYLKWSAAKPVHE